MASVNYDISSKYSTQAQALYQGNDILLAGRDGGARYGPIEKEEYRLAPQKQYDFGSVRSPAIGVIQPIRRPRRQESKDANIDDLPIIRQASTANLPSSSFTYHTLSINTDYSMRAAGTNHALFEEQKQGLARTIMAELAAIESKKTTLVQMN